MIRMFIAGLLFAALSVTGPAVAGEGREAIHAAAEDAQPLLPGMNAPFFTVKNVQGGTVQFDPTAMHKPVVLTFYRGGWCPYCNLHLSELRHAQEELLELGFDVWFISIDKPEVLAASLDEPVLGYTLLSDSKLHATRAFGVAFRLDDETFQKYVNGGHDLEGASGETHHVMPVPSTYIIGTDGVISFQYTNPDYHIRLHPDVLLAAARAYIDDADKRLRKRRAADRAKKQ